PAADHGAAPEMSPEAAPEQQAPPVSGGAVAAGTAAAAAGGGAAAWAAQDEEPVADQEPTATEGGYAKPAPQAEYVETTTEGEYAETTAPESGEAPAGPEVPGAAPQEDPPPPPPPGGAEDPGAAQQAPSGDYGYDEAQAGAAAGNYAQGPFGPGSAEPAEDG